MTRFLTGMNAKPVIRAGPLELRAVTATIRVVKFKTSPTATEPIAIARSWNRLWPLAAWRKEACSIFNKPWSEPCGLPTDDIVVFAILSLLTSHATSNENSE